MHFNNKVVLVTGGSRGLGEAFTRELARAGARVAINNTGSDKSAAQLAAEIVATGGQAFAAVGRVEEAGDLVGRVIDHAGQLDAVVHNAGFVNDKTLRKMTNEQWDSVLDVHLKSSWQLAQAAWPHFAAAGAGRLVLLSSAAGLYGNFGQANYAAAKMGMYGLSQTIAQEGASENITCNCVAPFGATTMNSANLPDELKAVIKPSYIAPLIGYLAHRDCTETGSLFEASGGAFKKVRWERSKGLRLDRDKPMSLADVAAGWEKLVDFSESEHPANMREALRGLYEESA